MFSKIASLCPGVYLDSPFSDYSTSEEWNAISPIPLIDHADQSYPELYLSCGLYDNYGNFEGTEALANLAIKRGVKTTWRPLYGGHCVIDVASLADFLASN